MIIVERICRYPLKSLAGESLSEAQLTKQGIHGDREWALVSPGQSNLHHATLNTGAWVPCQTFERLTIRPEMAAWHATSTATGVQLLVDGNDIRLEEGKEAMVAGRSVRLARANNGYWDHADATISIINLATVEAIAEAIGTTIDPARFRANIYIRAEPWSEFDWLGHELQFDSAILKVIRPTDRCKATSVAPGLGDITYNMPAQLNRLFGHIYCGVYAQVVKEGQINLGNIGSFVATNNVAGYNATIQSAAAQATAPELLNWPRSAQVIKIVEEAAGIRSVWLRDVLGSLGAWKGFRPGQHVRFHGLEAEGTWRTYTVSGYDNDLFRVTVKRDIGNGSGRMHDLKVGDKMTMTGLVGNLAVPHHAQSVHIITAGIGITPAVAMLADLLQYEHPIRFTHTARSDQIALWYEVESFAATRSNVRAELFISNVDSNFNSVYQGSCYSSQSGRPDLALVARTVYDEGAHVIICGPAGFSAEILAALAKENVPDGRIGSETFASVAIEANLRPVPSSGPHAVRFLESGIVTIWNEADGTLLDLAECHGLIPAAHCRAGICGTCSVNLFKEGQVTQLAGIPCQDGKVLLCCSVPTGDIELSL